MRPALLAVLALLAVTASVMLIHPSSAIIVEPDKSEYLIGEIIKLKVYTTGNASIQLIGDGSIVWEKRVNESGEVIIQTSSLNEGNYTIYAGDDKGETIKSIRLIAIKARASIYVPSKIEGNLTICGSTNLPDGYKLKIEVDGAGKGTKIDNSSFCSKFEVEEGVYGVKVLFGTEVLNETRVYVEGFRIRSVRFQPEIFVGEPLKIRVSANLKGFDVKIMVYNNKSERKIAKHVNSNSGEITFENTWMEPADYSVLILVIHGNSTDLMKLPLKIKKSFLSARVESFSDKKAIISAEAPINHIIWFISGSKINKSIVGGERKVLISMEVEGEEVLVIDQMNNTEENFLKMLNSGRISSLPHVKLDLNQPLTSVTMTPTTPTISATITPTTNESPVKEDIHQEDKTNQTGIGLFEGINVVAAVLTILIVGGILVGLVLIMRS